MNPPKQSPRIEPAIGSTEVLAECESFMTRHGVSASKLGKGALGDDRFIAKLRQGRDVYLSRVELVRTWIAGYETAVKDGLAKWDRGEG